MSAIFIVKYAGSPLRLGRPVKLVSEDQATPFTSEADAWTAIREYNLTPKLCSVIPWPVESLPRTPLDPLNQTTQQKN